jgi:hypothetical protein
MMQMSHDNSFALAALGALLCAAIGLFVVLDQQRPKSSRRPPIAHESPKFLAADFYDR